MVDLRGFDANEVEPTRSFEPIPAGEYSAIITGSEMKPTKAGTGEYLELTFQIIEGQYKNRQIWDRLNLHNPSDKAVEIARATLSAICRAVGIINPQDSEDMHALPLVIVVAHTVRSDTGEKTSEIRGYKKYGAATAEKAANTTSATTKLRKTKNNYFDDEIPF